MYRYHPQVKNILKIIKNDEIGKPISMESSFGINLLTKKRFFFFKKIVYDFKKAVVRNFFCIVFHQCFLAT